MEGNIATAACAAGGDHCAVAICHQVCNYAAAVLGANPKPSDSCMVVKDIWRFG